MLVGNVNAGGADGIMLRLEDLKALSAACQTQLREVLIRPDQEQEAALVESLQALLAATALNVELLRDVPARKKRVKVAGLTAKPI
jgi:hypothetical protein